MAKRTKSAPTEDDASGLTGADYSCGELNLADQPQSLVESYLQDSSAYQDPGFAHGSFDFTDDDIFGGLGLPTSGPSPEPYAALSGRAEAQSHRGGYASPTNAASSYTTYLPSPSTLQQSPNLLDTSPAGPSRRNTTRHSPPSLTLPAWQSSDASLHAPLHAPDYRTVRPRTDQQQLIVSIAIEITAQHLRRLLREITGGEGRRELPNFPGQSYNTTLRAFQRALHNAWASSGRTGGFPELDFARPYCGLVFEGE